MKKVTRITINNYKIEILRDPYDDFLPFVVKVSDADDKFSSPYELEGCMDEEEAKETMERFVKMYSENEDDDASNSDDA